MAKKKSRREALAIGLGLLGVAAGWQLWLRRPRDFDFEPIAGLPGWRKLPGGAVSGGASGAVFAGLDPVEPVAPLEPQRLCEALFATREGGVPVAVFTDLNCPYCRQIAPSLAARASTGAIALNWLEWPVYGGASVEVARALVAAGRMGEGGRLRELLYGASMPLSRAVAQAGLSRSRLEAQMASRAVEARLSDTRRAAALLGLPGTPSMMVGRTLVMGVIAPRDLDRLIEIEAGEGALPCA